MRTPKLPWNSQHEAINKKWQEKTTQIKISVAVIHMVWFFIFCKGTPWCFHWKNHGTSMVFPVDLAHTSNLLVKL